MTDALTTTLRPSTFTHPPPLVPVFSKDVDVVLQRDDLCIAWSGFYHAEELAVEVGIGSAPNKDDVVRFAKVENSESPACFINATALPAYTKLFSVVKAASSGGTSVFSSDGFRVVPLRDARNVMEVFNGRGCTDRDVIGSRSLRSSDTLLDLSAVTRSPIHPGDALFVRLSPFHARVTFSDAIVLQKTLAGYQIVARSANLTASFPPSSVTENTTVEVLDCWKDAEVIAKSSAGFDVSWESAGPWSSLMTQRVEITDETCVKLSVKKSKRAHLQCLVVSDTVRSPTEKATLRGDIISGHQYTASLTPCFDDGCLPSTSSKVVTYDSVPRTVTFTQAVMTKQTPQQIDIQVNAAVQPAIRSGPGQKPACVLMWSVTTDRYGSTTLTDWKVSESRDCSDIEVRESLCFPVALNSVPFMLSCRQHP